jgi:hypothetical protein
MKTMNRIAFIYGIVLFHALNMRSNHAFDPEHIGCACSKQISHLRLEKGLKSSGLEMDMKYNRFEWAIDPAVRYIKGAVTSMHVMNEDADEVTFDLSSVLTVDSVLYYDQSASFQHSGDVLTIFLPQMVSAGSLDSVSIFYQGVPPTGSGWLRFICTKYTIGNSNSLDAFRTVWLL